jgi:diaminohydroxyphosphoribosylaminopyrimidine deaminase/5-amino-6-(5-phosphoribosylamino)uracil reductase
VFGLHDPVPGHGGGADRIRAAGLAVDGPLAETEAACRRMVEPFLTVATLGRAHVTLKAAMTLDGRIATRTGESQWITGEAARADVHRLRDRVDAVLVGAGTALADDPRLTVRDLPGGRNPVRVLLDGKRRVKGGLRMCAETGRTIVVGGSDEPMPGAEIWRAAGQRVDLAWLTAELGRVGLHSLLVEGGGETHAGFLAAGLCDRLILYVAPLALGGPRGWLGGEGFASLAQAPRFVLDEDPIRVGDDVRLSFSARR